MGTLQPFLLEDFFCEYEHRRDVINLASSDALPWTLKELSSRFPEIEACIKETNLIYPNVKDMVIPRLRSFYRNPQNTVFLPTSGAAHALYLALQAIHCTQLGQVTIGIPKPAYGAFEGISRMFDFNVKEYFYRQDDNWQVKSEDVLALAAQCDVLIVNNPHNPTGRVMDRNLLRQIAKQLESHHGILIVDEVFLLPKVSPPDRISSLDIGANLLVIGGLSKVYGLPGLRFGWAAGPSELIGNMKTLQQYTTLSISTFAATIGSIALSRIADFSRYELLATNRRLLEQWSNSHRDLVRISPAEGGTTVILEILKPTVDIDELFEQFLREKVLLVPGANCFASKEQNWFRLGYGTESGKLQLGLDKIAKVLSRL